jgi:hypothetical protein
MILKYLLPSILWDIPVNGIEITEDTYTNTTWKLVESNPDIPWDYSYLSRNLDVSWDIVQLNIDKNWCYKNLSINPNITWEIIEKHNDKRWCYTSLSKNPNITWDIVNDNLHVRWDFYSMINNPNITWRKLNNILSCGSKFCSNPNITWRDIVHEVEPDILLLNSNKFERWNTASKIQRMFRRWSNKVRIEVSIMILYDSLPNDRKLPLEVCKCIIQCGKKE